MNEHNYNWVSSSKTTSLTGTTPVTLGEVQPTTQEKKEIKM